MEKVTMKFNEQKQNVYKTIMVGEEHILHYFQLSCIIKNLLFLRQRRIYNYTIIHFIETRLQYNWHNNKNADSLVNRLASNLVILNQAHRVAWLQLID